MAQRWRGNRYSIDSLRTMVMDYVIKNLSFYQNSEFEALKQLPIPLKNGLLKKFTETEDACSKDVDFNEFLLALINEHTIEINMSLFSITDSVLEKFCVCKNMRKISWVGDVIDCKFTSAGLINFLEHTPELTFLMLPKSDEVNDEVLKCISNSCHKLELLVITGFKNITNTGLMYLNNINMPTTLKLHFVYN